MIKYNYSFLSLIMYAEISFYPRTHRLGVAQVI